MDHFEVRLMVSKVLRVCNLVPVFWWEEDKMASVMLEILDGFSSERVLMYRHSKSTLLQVTLNFELK